METQNKSTFGIAQMAPVAAAPVMVIQFDIDGGLLHFCSLKGK